MYKKLKKLGNFRRGTISVHYRKCGKKNCACAKPGYPGHGPQYLWTTTIKKKSYSKNLKMGPELQKYREETENYKTFMQLYKLLTFIILGDVEKVIAAMKRLAPSLEEQQEEIKNQIGYFEKNKERMRYKKFREQGLFVGSGVVEAGCKNVIGQRLKQSGMHWTVNGANKIIALRCCLFSNRWEDYWEYRAIG